MRLKHPVLSSLNVIVLLLRVRLCYHSEVTSSLLSCRCFSSTVAFSSVTCVSWKRPVALQLPSLIRWTVCQSFIPQNQQFLIYVNPKWKSLKSETLKVLDFQSAVRHDVLSSCLRDPLKPPCKKYSTPNTITQLHQRTTRGIKISNRVIKGSLGNPAVFQNICDSFEN